MKDKAKKILILGGSILVTIIIIISAIIIINSKKKQAEEKTNNISEHTIYDKLLEENNQDTESSIAIDLQEDEERIDKGIQVSKDEGIVVEENKEQVKQEQLYNATDKKITETKNNNNKSEISSETVTPEKTKEDNSKPIENATSNKNEEKVDENKNGNNSSNNDVNNKTGNNTNNNEDKNIDSDINTSNNTDKKEETNNTETKVVETFVYNDKMAKKIKSIIETNESEYMKKYGYNVIIDESIVNLTNQFTFTEDRVIDSLKYKFNTIKVYARDYYVNGAYMWTECFII